jgi:DNA polymerase III delta prime subunit
MDNINNGYYVEYNCAHTGSAEAIRELQDSFSYSYVDGYRVVAFDEIHLSSSSAQGALLHAVEEAPKELFFVFCTTESDKVIDTLKSRSLEIFFEIVYAKEILQLLSDIVDKEKVKLSNEVLTRISKRCRGDVRSSFHMLEEAIILGEEEFLNNFVLLDEDIQKLFISAIDPNVSVEDYKRLIGHILLSPVEYIRSDFERCISNLSTAVYVDKKQGTGRMESFIVEWLKNQRYIGGRNDWRIFFNSLRRFAPNSEFELSAERQRFLRKD